jgi:hypothetical protein
MIRIPGIIVGLIVIIILWADNYFEYHEKTLAFPKVFISIVATGLILSVILIFSDILSADVDMMVVMVISSYLILVSAFDYYYIG